MFSRFLVGVFVLTILSSVFNISCGETMGKINLKPQAPTTYLTHNSRQNKMSYSLRAGYSLGVNSQKINLLKTEADIQAHLGKHLSLGAGTGMHYVVNTKDALLPVYGLLGFSRIFPQAPVYLSVRSGVTVDLMKGMQSEGVYLLFNPEIGYELRLSNHLKCTISVGYDFHKYKMSYQGYGVTPGSVINLQGISANVGLIL